MRLKEIAAGIAHGATTVLGPLHGGVRQAHHGGQAGAINLGVTSRRLF
jgi:hypothetical protein